MFTYLDLGNEWSSFLVNELSGYELSLCTNDFWHPTLKCPLEITNVFFCFNPKKNFIVKIIPGAKIADKVKLENTVANSPLVIVIVLIGKLFAWTKMSYLESNYTKN